MFNWTRKLTFQLQPAAWWLLAIGGLFGLAVGLSNTFVNIFIWKIDRNYTSTAWYNLWMYVCIPIAFVAASWLAKKFRVVIPLRIGIAGHALFYCLVLFWGQQLARYPIVLGIGMGLAAGFYWFSFNVLSIHFTSDAHRSNFMGMNGVFAAIAGMIAPPVAGFLISREDLLWGGLTGFHLVFGLSIALFAAGTVISWKINTECLENSFMFNQALQSLKIRSWRMKVFGCLFYGMREGLFLFLIGLLFFIATGSEFTLGEFLFLQSGLAFVANFVSGKLAQKRRRILLMGSGALGMFAAATIFLLPVNAMHLWIYGALLSATLPFFLVPMQSLIYAEMDEMEEKEKLFRHQHIITREIFENTGRVLGIVSFLLLLIGGHQVHRIAMLAFGLGCVQLGTWILFKWSEPVRVKHVSDHKLASIRGFTKSKYRQP
ncbi:MFS transporter [Alicyclobacillus tolerans]|uniref:YQGE family putative transporter n=1 Tax=Alicyclobacillus tolerans TaxID=90970 RepID=A0ABT9LTF0_9BACL|nr:MFS transporter [Alicyclobacillus tengchongensis]MDP9727531.1 YQGE family putative transporter [Alicyclobacillus tengchongensis]